MNDLERMRDLVKILNDYAYHYYVLEKPVVSDYDYDKLYDELVLLEEKLNIVLDESPTKRVGGEVLSGFKKVYHEVPLFSLNKCNDLEGLEKFISDTKKTKNDINFTVEYKFDGLRIIAKYKDGKFFEASTRGNGVVGEDVTEQVKTIKSVPLTIDYKGEVTVAGEGVITQENLKKYNEKAEEKLKNARNAVAGAIRNLDPKITSKRNLDVVFYDIIKIDKDFLKTQEDVYNFLKSNKFLTGKLFEVCDSAMQISKIIDRVDKIKSTLDIVIDGLVIKLNDLKLREEIGFTSKYPKWAIAYKFAPVEMTSILKDVEWNVGRTGKVTPIAIIDPIELAGATVSRATLNNYEDILRKNVKINSLVFVRRSNEVIPEILGLAKEEENSFDIIKPKFCPSCKSILKEVGPNLFCENEDCRDKQIAKISFFATRNCMDIEGLSDKIVEVLYDEVGVKRPSDLYKLDKKDLEKLEGFKDKKIKNLLFSIEKSKSPDFNNFINALSIDGVGEKTSKDLVKKFKNLENLKRATLEDLINIKDIGEVTAKNIVEYFSSTKNLDEIDSLLSLGVKIKEGKEIKIDENNFFYNKKFVLTGTLSNYKRDEATKIIESFGGVASSSVSKNTDYVLYGEEAGSKLEKAKNLNVKLLSEEEFIKEVSKLSLAKEN